MWRRTVMNDDTFSLHSNAYPPHHLCFSAGRIRPYNPAINEDKRLTARCVDGVRVVNQTGSMEQSYNFTRVFG